MRSQIHEGGFQWRKLSLLPSLLFALLMAVAMQASATYPVQITFTLEGCRLETGAIYDQSTYTCTDEGYTTGNLGKQWNELDYVPHRVTLQNGNGAQTFNFLVSGDYRDNGDSTTGWDDISELTLNTDLSDATCNPVQQGIPVLTPPGGGAGGAFQTIFRAIEATMAPDETCVYDYAQRLSLGASEFTGSSLQSNLWNEDAASSGIGQKRIQLPVADILPQELSKDMSAQQDTNYIWNLTKTADPSNLQFLDSCKRDDPMTETSTIRIEWQRLPGEPGMVTVITNIYAHNPAHLDVHISVEDKVYGDTGGGEVLLDTASANDVVVPAGTTKLLLTHQFSAPSNVTGLNDVAVATYKIDGTTVPGDTDATASTDVQPSGNSNNETAVITDVEGPITGLGYSFSVDSVDGDGTFQGGYLLGDEVVGAVTWVSSEQSGDGYVEFEKTIYLDEPRNSNGSLPDVATLVSGEYEVSKNAAINFFDAPLVDLTINKTIDKDILGEGESATFYFDVYDSEGLVADDVLITIESGETSGSAVVEGLEPGVEYSVYEVDGSDGFLLDADVEVLTIVLPLCGGDVSFQNEALPASAKVIKVTVPEGYDPSGFEFTLTGPGLPVGGVTAVSNGDGEAVFLADLFEGVYEVTETPKLGWELTDIIGDSVDLEAGTCSFEVDLPEDAGYQFLCTFENTALATIIITKRVEGNNALDLSGSFSFDSSVSEFDDLLAAESWSFGDVASGTETSNTFVNLFPGTYDVTEATPPLLWGFTDVFCDDPTGNSSVNADPSVRLATIELDPGETVECTFVNTKLAAPGNLIIYKRTLGDLGNFGYTSPDLPLPAFDVATLAEDVFYTEADATFNGLVSGIYHASEVVPAGWDLTGLYCEDDTTGVTGGSTSVDLGAGEVTVSIDNGETVSCYYTNTRRGYIRLHKETIPDGAEGLFHFDGYLNGDIGDGGSIPASGYQEVQPNGLYTSTEIVPDGWDLTNISCVETKVENTGIYYQTSSVQFNVQPGEYIDCTFTNTKRGDVDLIKLANGVETSTPYNFTLVGPGVNTSDNTTPVIDFGHPDPADMWLLPNATYTICETGIPAGTTAWWSANGSPLDFVGGTDDLIDDGLLQVYNPDDDGTPSSEDLGNRCVNFQVGPGVSLSLLVDNRTPLGDARTPGYWKNWSYCSGGNQFAKATEEYHVDPSGLIDTRHYTLDEILTTAKDHAPPIYANSVYDTGVYIGLLALNGDPDGDVYDGTANTDCENAVLVLNSADQEATRGGKDKAVGHSNDPAYKLGRYLLAYIANQAAGAYQCDLAADAAEAAQDLLVDQGFDGTGDYLTKKNEEEAAANALYYHGILGQYVENDPALNCGVLLNPPYSN
ncbi:MSCRAMM family protein [Marinobacterium mangrovicola]|uniref:SpaA-like prealbumin fold domain-containing protein n=1 Tax=Marinobacterium mangrovicola TaxID=1476959 RepID=A0A4R1GN81_9GAMM|nr:hypothetical protein [Marinobacterium mangrovicola]TCK08771.1 hypothetical protein CLV83_0863 [Marinobacterium mangrovicola]